jgi:hypothetical protein
MTQGSGCFGNLGVRDKISVHAASMLIVSCFRNAGTCFKSRDSTAGVK